ncbi:hypothetical protein GDO81_022813 [Engystomops pustulosus]|uniref:Uncharacterized protein n=1 Tax=Engystomops pustulosus TaxID=76066 RepID=A0AAV6YN44_ENGPU|nr:hypothetical protein GDO81_022813 [Engystomops pustulosus]
MAPLVSNHQIHRHRTKCPSAGSVGSGPGVIRQVSAERRNITEISITNARTARGDNRCDHNICDASANYLSFESVRPNAIPKGELQDTKLQIKTKTPNPAAEELTHRCGSYWCSDHSRVDHERRRRYRNA